MVRGEAMRGSVLEIIIQYHVEIKLKYVILLKGIKLTA
jgi:hypothetical protein